MARLPKSIIKKYGISKKAWSVYRAQKGRSRTVSVGGKVAKRRKKSGKKSVARRMASNQFAPAVGAFAYGAMRQATLAKVVDPVLNNIQLPVVGQMAQYTDEAAMFALSWAISKGKVPFVNKVKVSRSIGRAGMLIEASRLGQMIGAQTVNGLVSQFGTSTPAQQQTSGKLF